jgi:hypothetical protein
MSHGDGVYFIFLINHGDGIFYMEEFLGERMMFSLR